MGFLICGQFLELIYQKGSMKNGRNSGSTSSGSGCLSCLRENVAHLENDGEFYDIINRTNNGLERYNRHYNGLFLTKPDLFQFVRILQHETRNQVQKIDDVRKGRRKEVERNGVTIPQIPIGYYSFKGSQSLVQGAPGAPSQT